MSLSRLIYISRPAFPVRPGWLKGQLGDIMSQSRSNNPSAGITGLLGVEPNRFFQILEGDTDKLAATFERIRKDRRHFEVLQRHFAPITERLFSDWAVGFATRRHLPDHIPLELDFETLAPEEIVERGLLLRQHGVIAVQDVG